MNWVHTRMHTTVILLEKIDYLCEEKTKSWRKDEKNRYHENNEQERNNEKKKAGRGYFHHIGRRREDGKDKSAVHGG